MSYDHAELEQIIRTGGKLPDELVEIFKKNAAQRRSERAGARRRKITQHMIDIAKATAAWPFASGSQRVGRNRPGRLSPNPVPAGGPPQPLACDSGFNMIGNTFAPFSWGSPVIPEYGQPIADQPGAHQSSQMTRPQTGEFSLAFVVMSDPSSEYAPVMDEVLGFKGVEISATIGQVYFVAGQSPLMVSGHARLATVQSSLASRIWVQEASAVAAGSATITVSELAIDWTLQQGPQSKLLDQSSLETELFSLLLPPFAGSASADDDPGPIDLSVRLKHHNDATLAMVEVDIDILGYVNMGVTNSREQGSTIYLDYRVPDDPDLVVGPEPDDTSYYDSPWPYPSPIILTQTRLCGFYPKPNP